MPEFIPVIKKEQIETGVAEMARRINADYEGKSVVLVGVLKGALIFLADLMRQLTIPVQVDFLRAASYGSGDTSCGAVLLKKDIEIDLADRNVLIVEDIVDTGLTLARMVDHIRSKNCRSVRVCALIDKRERRKSAVTVDYACHVVEEGFLIGYGLDYAEDYRQLPEIYHLKL